LGIEIEINKIDPSKIEDIIKKREYELLLFGEILGSIPDPFPFWHSSQKNDPGLNLALYENKDVDKLLKEARQTLDEAKRKEDLEKFQDILIGDAPAVFLYSPTYIYFVSKKIKVINAEVITDSSKRFIGIENWYLKTKRAWK
jgi:peptide/nickel transport system substrate-binding protein